MKVENAALGAAGVSPGATDVHSITCANGE